QPTFCSQVTGPFGNQVTPIFSVRGMRVGRLRITEQWDGRDGNGLLVPDGQYIFTLTAQSTTTPTHFATDRIVGDVNIQRGQIVFPKFDVQPDIAVMFNSSNTIALHPYTIN